MRTARSCLICPSRLRCQRRDPRQQIDTKCNWHAMQSLFCFSVVQSNHAAHCVRTPGSGAVHAAGRTGPCLTWSQPRVHQALCLQKRQQIPEAACWVGQTSDD